MQSLNPFSKRRLSTQSSQNVLRLMIIAGCLVISVQGECADNHEFCPFWQSIGECESNPDWMNQSCPKSCNVCDKLAGENGSGEDSENNSPNRDATTTTTRRSNSVTRATRAPIPVTTRTNTRTTVNNNNAVNGNINRGRSSGPPKQNHNDVGACNLIQQRDAPTHLFDEGLIVSFEELGTRRPVTLSQARNSNTQFGCTPPQSQFVDCKSNACYHLKFRTLDGTCNNLQDPLRGASFMPLMRHKEAVYDDGIDAPTGSIKNDRPSARDLSRFLLSSSQVVANDHLNGMVMQWGQFISHDIVRTTMLPNDECRNCNVNPGSSCISIKVNPLDPSSRTFGCQKPPEGVSGPQCCVRTARSSPVCGSGLGGSGQREHYNENTAFIDASHVYGSSLADANRFRLPRSGFMRTQIAGGRVFLPSVANANRPVNFQAGDDRANLFLGLSAMHTIFVREHNRLVTELRAINPHWDGERLYQEARKIVGAEMQAVTYNEYLPVLLGNEFFRVIGRYEAYDPRVNPDVANVFSTGAFRFGHGMVTEFFRRKAVDGTDMPGYRFLEGVFQSSKLVNEGGIDPVIVGLLASPAKRPHRITTSMTERLFGNVDLAAVNIERGREHGLPSYNDWREFCNLRRANNFDDLATEMTDAGVRKNLANEYDSPDKIDLYVGQLMEDPVQGGMVGPIVACLLGEQFRRLRDGDRFWYQNPGVFSRTQLAQLEQVRLGRILCDNGDNMHHGPPDAFLMMDPKEFTECDRLRKVDLFAWKE